MVGILDDEEAVPKRSSGVELPVWMWDELDAIAKRRGKSRNRIVFLLLKNGLELVAREEKIAEPDKGGPTKRKGH
jgi:metal-responsive CopG/Arc/MetJ family transcriptional regulator